MNQKDTVHFLSNFLVVQAGTHLLVVQRNKDVIEDARDVRVEVAGLCAREAIDYEHGAVEFGLVADGGWVVCGVWGKK